MSGFKRPDWTTYFLDIAAVVAQRSTCLRRHYGSIITRDNIIISTGYNGSPRGEANCCETGLCKREQFKVPKGERYELCVGVHAEQNAIINGDPLQMKGATMYTVGFNADGSYTTGAPCLLCRRMLKNARIQTVIFREPDGSVQVRSVDTLEDIG